MNLEEWVQEQNKRIHSLAVKYIENHVDLLETDLVAFMKCCPSSCHIEVYEMLLKAGIDMKSYTVPSSFKKYVYNTSSIHTIDYKQKLDDYIEKAVTYKPQ